MKILLTGAQGFTGRHFSELAVRAGHEVLAMESDLRDRDGLKQEMLAVAPEAVVHLAAISFVGHAKSIAFYDVNVIGTLNLLDAVASLPVLPSKILLASSANVYGNCIDSPIKEYQPPEPVNHYAASKLSMEFLAKNYLNRIPLFFVRPFNYTGVGQAESFVIPKLVAHFARSAAYVELGNLDVEREFNDVRFICDAYLKLLVHGISGETYNVCSGAPVTLRTVIELLRNLSGHDLEVRVNPAFVRSNEVHRLCGVPTKLENCIGLSSHPALRDTLRWMLDAQSTK